jgi:hypothetical protein
MTSNKFRRNSGRRQNCNPGSMQQVNQLQILVSSPNLRIGEYYQGLEDEILGVELSVIHVEPKHTLQESAKSPR